MNTTSTADDKRVIRTKIGERLKAERAKAGFNQADFSANGAVSKASQVAYESGVNAPDAVYLTRLAAHIDLLYVLTGVPAPVHAGLQLDWELMERLTSYIRALEKERGIQLPVETFIRFQRILYAASVSTREVDRGLLEAVFESAG